LELLFILSYSCFFLKGILGVWLDWEINESNNKFIGMKMMNGDECGASLGRRSSKVLFYIFI
jgi:hypothetical protein